MALAFQLVSKVIFQSSQKCESCLDQLQMDRSAGVLKSKVIYDVKRTVSVKARKKCHLRLMTLRGMKYWTSYKIALQRSEYQNCNYKFKMLVPR